MTVLEDIRRLEGGGSPPSIRRPHWAARLAMLSIEILCGAVRLIGFLLALPGLVVVGAVDDLGFWAEQRRRGIM